MSQIGCPACMKVAKKLTILFSITGADLHRIVRARPDTSTRLKMEVAGTDFSEGSRPERGGLISYALEQLQFWVVGRWGGGVRNPKLSISRAARSLNSFGYPSEAVRKRCCVLCCVFSMKEVDLLCDWSCQF